MVNPILRISLTVYKLGALCMQWLQDKVYSIHKAAENNLKRFAEEFGPEWAMQHLVPQVLDMVTNPHYLHRMMVLREISLMATSSKRQVQCGKTSAISHPHSRPVSGGENNMSVFGGPRDGNWVVPTRLVPPRRGTQSMRVLAVQARAGRGH
ncbi:hypothetical protein F2Q68_00019541 [Brassica cretica]|uniref:Uncharacterized protein n=1 Tax=Brassica cretica TaxID=69181 RepID=A0A8S9G1S8_BRACR|nr:hypothetical protein F2Q68_00019541 [Brassica cretica]